ncbi:hypothetical protein LTR15_002815 [Elasticomyces elasticus]|nr:hypothetical protein LTR15_002815 [Elasticomyces elasticus]
MPPCSKPPYKHFRSLEGGELVAQSSDFPLLFDKRDLAISKLFDENEGISSHSSGTIFERQFSKRKPNDKRTAMHMNWISPRDRGLLTNPTAATSILDWVLEVRSTSVPYTPGIATDLSTDSEAYAYKDPAQTGKKSKGLCPW